MDTLQFGDNFPTRPAQKHTTDEEVEEDALSPLPRREAVAFNWNTHSPVSQGGPQWSDLGLLLRGAA